MVAAALFIDCFLGCVFLCERCVGSFLTTTVELDSNSNFGRWSKIGLVFSLLHHIIAVFCPWFFPVRHLICGHRRLFVSG